jgi:hypothetical protein
MRKLTTWTTTVVLLGAWVSVANASGIWTEELWTWIVRWFVMQAGGDWS